MTDAKPSHSDAPPLAELRREIDRIDEEMHALLMERGKIIDRLIRVKQTQETGSAFRPAREADMMRRLVDRHRGILPLDTAESIWRVIIATFTFVQAPFSVHADLSSGDALMRDSARFHFGFTVPFVAHMGAAAVIAAVSQSKGDLGLVPAFAAAGAWWSALETETAPKIIARLPFVDRDDHPAALPVFVVSRVAPDAMVTEVATWSLRVAGWNAATAQKTVSSAGALTEVIAVVQEPSGGEPARGEPTRGEATRGEAALLVSLPQGMRIASVTDALAQAGATLISSALVGSHATRYRVPASKT